MENGHTDEANDKQVLNGHTIEASDQQVLNGHTDETIGKQVVNGHTDEAIDKQVVIGDSSYPDDEQQLLDDSVTSRSINCLSRWGGPVRHRLITVEVPVTLIVIAYGTMLNLRGQYIRQQIAENYGIYGPPGSYQMSCNDTGNSSSIDSEIQAKASEWSIALSATESVPTLFTIAILGAWSDKAGRTTAMLIPTVGFVLTTLLFIIIVLCKLPLTMFFICSVIQGSTGGFQLIIALSFSYIADITTKEKRVFRIVLIEMIFFLGAGLSQIGVGYFLKAAGYAAPLLMAEFLCVLAFFYIITPALLPETVPRGHINPLQTGRRRGQVIKNVMAMFKDNTNKRRRKLLVSFGAIFVCATVSTTILSLEALYAQGLPFCWGSILLGYFTAVDLTAIGFGALLGAKLLPLCLPEIYIVYISIIDSALSLAVFAAATSTPILFLSCPIGFLRGLPVPVLKTMLSKMVAGHEQGALFASLGSLQAIGGFISPLFLNSIYAATVAFFPPLVFYVMVGLYCIPLFLVCLLHIFLKTEANEEPSSTTTVPVNGEETVPTIN